VGLGTARKLARARPAPDAVAELLPLLWRGTRDERRNALQLYHELAVPRTPRRC